MVIGLFTGQGSQYSGMGRDLYENFQSVREIYECGEDILEFDLKKISFYGELEELSQSRVIQPAIFAHSFSAYTAFLEIGEKPSGLGGHSLGEFGALAAGGAYSLEDAFRIIKARSEAMAVLEEGEGEKGAMTAVMRLSSAKVKELCDSVSGFVQPANYNLEMQTVISGELLAVEEVEELIKQQGGRGIRLGVSNAFHTPLMKKAGEELCEKIESINYSKTSIPFFSNVTGGLTIFHKELPNYPEYFYNHMVSPVKFTKEMDAMTAFGGEKYIEFGPKKTVTGLVKKHLPKAVVFGVDTMEDLKKVEM